jgi:hypothetical protein
MGKGFGESVARVMTWPFDKLIVPEQDTSDSGRMEVTPSEETGKIEEIDSVEVQAAQRRMARLGKYLTSPRGVLGDPSVGRTGVFS